MCSCGEAALGSGVCSGVQHLHWAALLGGRCGPGSRAAAGHPRAGGSQPGPGPSPAESPVPRLLRAWPPPLPDRLLLRFWAAPAAPFLPLLREEVYANNRNRKGCCNPRLFPSGKIIFIFLSLKGQGDAAEFKCVKIQQPASLLFLEISSRQMHICEKLGIRRARSRRGWEAAPSSPRAPASFRVAWGAPALPGRPRRPGPGQNSPSPAELPTPEARAPRTCRRPVLGVGRV